MIEFFPGELHQIRRVCFVSQIAPNGLPTYNCSVSQTHVETEVKCTESARQATGMRRSKVDTRTANDNIFGTVSCSVCMEVILTLFPSALGVPHSAFPSIAEHLLTGDISIAMSSSEVNYSTVCTTDFSHQLHSFSTSLGILHSLQLFLRTVKSI